MTTRTILAPVFSGRHLRRDSQFGIVATDLRRRDQSGAALMLSLWALFLLSAVVISWALDINSRIAVAGNANRVLEAEALACSGAEIALHPSVKFDSPLLSGGFSRTQRFEAHITGEGGRLNLNWIVAGENPARIELLRKYLENKGVDLNERDRMIDTLLDWVDPDNLVRLNGAENEGNYRPRNGLLTRIEEVKKIRGWEDFTARPNWDEDFTINSKPGTIDLKWATKGVLLALPGMTEPQIDQFLTMRRGPDGIDGTFDDTPFKSADEIGAALGFNPQQFAQIRPLLSFGDPVLRVVSEGRSGNVTRTVRMVIQKTNNSVQLINWKEL